MTDLYGFRLPALTVDEQRCREQQFTSTHASLTEANWSKALQNQSAALDVGSNATSRTGSNCRSCSGTSRLSTIKALVRKGIPVSERPLLWTAFTGSVSKKGLFPTNHYKLLTNPTSISSDVLCIIDEDVRATYVNMRQHSMFRDQIGMAALWRVLVALAQHNVDAGYTKGSHLIAAFLLVVMGIEREEDVFWMLTCVLHDRLFSYCQGQVLCGSKVEQRVLELLVQQRMPKLHKHLQALQCSLVTLTEPWFTTLFVASLPAESVARVWDCLLFEGPKVMHRAALALLKKYETTILSCSHPLQLKKVLDARINRTYDADALLHCAFYQINVFSSSMLNEKRLSACQEVEQRVQAYKQRLADLICN